jgi:molybdopterin-containing oxidoreductase family iron-sulfur binding subunit
MNGEKIWKIFQQKDSDVGMSRRTFIEMIGFSAAALAFSSCRPPQQKIIPFVNQPVELTPGLANWYASACGGCAEKCGALVKVREGRPIKLEGNPQHPLTGGGLCAVAHAMVFGLYDAERLQQPLIGSKSATWEEIDKQIKDKFEAIKKSGGKVRLLTSPLSSPTSRETIAKFLSQFADGRHIVYEAVSTAAIPESHLRTHKTAAMPVYDFEKAKLVVSFSADFLGTWVSPVQFTRAYSRARNVQDGQREMLRHVQMESRMSLTGSNADIRIRVSPSEEISALLLLARLVAEKTGGGAPKEIESADTSSLKPKIREEVEKIAVEIARERGRSLVVSGSNDADAQSIVNFINHRAGNYGSTIHLQLTSSPLQSGDLEMVRLVEEMKQGQVSALLFFDANPAYDYFASDEFLSAMSKVPLKVSFNPTVDETTALADFTCPHPHFLEAWDDVAPAPRVYSLNQPTIAPLFQTRPYQESLLRWSGDQRAYYDVLRESWKTKLFPQQKKHATFDEFWDTSLHDGVFAFDSQPAVEPAFAVEEAGRAADALRPRAIPAGLNLALYEKVALRDGRYANNPWLHELPDPVTKVTWDNYAAVSPRLAEELGLEEGRMVRVTSGSASVEIPVYIQTGQDDSTIAIALGYGRTKAGRGGSNVGVNAFPLVSFENGAFQYTARGVRIEKTDAKHELAVTQRHNTLDGRPIFHEVALADYLEGRMGEELHHEEPHSIWKDHPYGEHKWAMVVDLNACTGCSACLLSCQAENNVPVVGREEVLRQREMHWIRLDRYYRGDDENTSVAHQPVMCSQCDNASCESVCPVLATVHSSEGLNMQVYNRCVGTRYCANNCAYKVRRFNWFEYPHEDPLANLALNPDVTVRTRGVMEKCTFCIQRIEEVKIRARNEGRDIGDSEIQVACQQSCPANAISFGDMTSAESRVNRLKHDRRDYILLEELNLRPQISYLAKVRNSPAEEA